MKLKKVKKSKKQRGDTTHGHGARKKWKGSGHRGGKGMAGTGKRADQKKSLVIKLYGNKYFGKKGITSKGTARKKVKVMNLRDIQKNVNSLKKNFSKDNILDLSKYKILGEGEIVDKLTIKAREFSKSAIEKIKKAGGDVIVLKKKEKKTDKKETNNVNQEKQEVSKQKDTKTQS